MLIETPITKSLVLDIEWRTMNLSLAHNLAELARVAYQDDPTVSISAEYCDCFHGQSFNGYVASDQDMVVVAFRGTQTNCSSLPNIVSSVRQWLTNFSFAQDQAHGNCRVHRGFSRELATMYDDHGFDLQQAVSDHGGHNKPLYVTGHSAGAAFATIAARRLHEADIPVDAAYVFSSPRIGDKQFAETYPLPLYRFEYMDDIVPHVPFPPKIAGLFDSFFDGIYPLIGKWFPNFMEYAPRNTEYVHAGKLFFVDWNNEFVYSHNLDEFLGDIAKALFWGTKPSLPGSPMPKSLMDNLRGANTVVRLLDYFQRESDEFIEHHAIDGFLPTMQKYFPSQ